MLAAARLHPKKCGTKATRSEPLREVSKTSRPKSRRKNFAICSHHPVLVTVYSRGLSPMTATTHLEQAELRRDAYKQVRQYVLAHCMSSSSFEMESRHAGAPIRGDGQGGRGSPGCSTLTDPALVQVPSNNKYRL
jgi:hypothetical protein